MIDLELEVHVQTARLNEVVSSYGVSMNLKGPDWLNVSMATAAWDSLLQTGGLQACGSLLLERKRKLN